MIRVIFFIIFLSIISALAKANTDYPYTNPEKASLTSSIMKSIHSDSFKFNRTFKTKVIPGREKTAFIKKEQSHLTTMFYPQKKEAPLVLLIADITGSPVSGYMMYMADIMQSNGYNVITLPSPLFWNFVVSSSSTALPGLTHEDAIDMYNAIQMVLSDVKSVHRYKFTKISVVGLGFGGLLAAHLADLDKNEKKINIDQFVLINPIVNTTYSITEIETRTAIALELGMQTVEWIKTKAFNFVVDSMNDSLKVTSPDFFLDLDKKFPLSEKEYKFLSGAVLRMNVTDTLFASQLVNNLGILKTSLSKFKANARHAETDEYGLVGYIKNFFLPFHQKSHSMLEILKQSNLNYVRKTLAENKNIFLIHNSDDFLLDKDQFEYLENLFEADRRIIYPYGGHLGNLWFEKNRSDLLNILSKIKN